MLTVVRQARDLLGIRKRAEPADLSVEQPMRSELVVNMTAKALGLTVPQSVPFRAD